MRAMSFDEQSTTMRSPEQLHNDISYSPSHCFLFLEGTKPSISWMHLHVHMYVRFEFKKWRLLYHNEFRFVMLILHDALRLSLVSVYCLYTFRVKNEYLVLVQKTLYQNLSRLVDFVGLGMRGV